LPWGAGCNSGVCTSSGGSTQYKNVITIAYWDYPSPRTNGFLYFDGSLFQAVSIDISRTGGLYNTVVSKGGFDLNNDGANDFVFSGCNDWQLTSYYGSSNISDSTAWSYYNFYSEHDSGSGSCCYAADVGDVSGDGLPDVVAVEYPYFGVYVNGNQNSGDAWTYYSSLPIPNSYLGVGGVIVKDFNGDKSNEIMINDNLAMTIYAVCINMTNGPGCNGIFPSTIPPQNSDFPSTSSPQNSSQNSDPYSTTTFSTSDLTPTTSPQTPTSSSNISDSSLTQIIGFSVGFGILGVIIIVLLTLLIIYMKKRMKPQIGTAKISTLKGFEYETNIVELDLGADSND